MERLKEKVGSRTENSTGLGVFFNDFTALDNGPMVLARVQTGIH